MSDVPVRFEIVPHPRSSRRLAANADARRAVRPLVPGPGARGQLRRVGREGGGLRGD